MNGWSYGCSSGCPAKAAHPFVLRCGCRGRGERCAHGRLKGQLFEVECAGCRTARLARQAERERELDAMLRMLGRGA
jgi:hypothetical protein